LSGDTRDAGFPLPLVYQVVLVNERVRQMDGRTGEIKDLGPANPPARWFRSALSEDAETLVLWGVDGS
jgi:hypothetical protein